MTGRLLVVASMCGLIACGDDPRAATLSHAAIVDGELTNGFESVVAIALQRTRCEDPPAVLCSGTLIGPRAVLSAAHCFLPMRPGLEYEVFVGGEAGLQDDGVAVVSVVTHPGFDEVSRRDDLALLWLARAFEGVVPEELPTGGSPGPGVGAPVELVGFGATSPGTVPDGAKRVGAGRIGSADAATVSVDPEPSVSCVGDSGGPLFTAAGAPAFVGVASSGDPGCRETSVYALIAPAMESFVVPTLDAGPPTEPVEIDVCGPPIQGPDRGASSAGSCVVGPNAPKGRLGTVLWLALTLIGMRSMRSSWG